MANISVPLLELIKPIAAVDVKKTLYTLFARVGIDTSSWKPGDPTRTITAAVSVWQAAFTSWASKAIRLKFLALSEKDWLRAVAHYDYGTDYHTEQPARGPVRFVNSSSNSYDFEAGDLTVKWTKTNIDQTVSVFTYTNTEAFAVSANGSVSSPIVADIAGSMATLPAGAVVTISPQITGLSVTVTSTLLGQDIEADQQLINRAQDAASATSPNGPWDVYRYIATSLLDDNGNQICGKCTTVAGNPVRLVVESPGGTAIAGSLSDPSTPLGRLNRAVQVTCVPLGVTAVVVNASSLSVSINYTVYVARNSQLTDAAIMTLIDQSLNDLFDACPIGGYVIPTDLVDSTHVAGSRWLFFDSIKAAVENAAANVQGVVNPIFKAVVTVGNNSTADISVSSTQQPVKATVRGLVARQ